MNIQQSKSIKITEYLAAKGVEPVAIRGKDVWYRSPLREDHQPSFSVNGEKNLWFDLGLNKGGDLIELVKMLYNCKTSEALENISNVKPLPFDISSFECKNDSQIDIRKKTPGLSNNALINYIQSRGLDPQLAGLYLWEIYYQIAGKNYFAVAFKNDSEGFELRNKYFKGSVAPKDITTLSENSTDCCIFEGWPDFLTYKQYFEVHPSDYLILNSVAMVRRAIEPLKKYKTLFYLGQNDESGQKVMETMQAAGLTLLDYRFEYENFKDLNEKYIKK